jgi:hypothetical protein
VLLIAIIHLSRLLTLPKRRVGHHDENPEKSYEPHIALALP